VGSLKVSSVDAAGGDWLIYIGARVSRSSKTLEKMLEEVSPERISGLLSRLLKMGHLSVFEHSLARVWLECDPRELRELLFDWKFVEATHVDERMWLVSLNPRTAIEMLNSHDDWIKDLAKEVLKRFPAVAEAAGLGGGAPEVPEVHVRSASREGIKVHLLSSHPWEDPRHGFHAFLIEGISRVCSHQFVRHRSLSFTQQSQRVAEVVDYYLPGHLDEATREIMRREVERALQLYYRLMDSGVKMEDARYILPQACVTRMVVSGRDSAWMHFLRLRLSPEAQREIRIVAELISDLSGLRVSESA